MIIERVAQLRRITAEIEAQFQRAQEEKEKATEALKRRNMKS
jgi:hypothetical protein